MTADRPRSVEQRYVDWSTAYMLIRDTITPQPVSTALRGLAGLAVPGADMASLNLGMAASRLLYANDRAAAYVAAMLTSSGVKVVLPGEEE